MRKTPEIRTLLARRERDALNRQLVMIAIA